MILIKHRIKSLIRQFYAKDRMCRSDAKLVEFQMKERANPILEFSHLTALTFTKLTKYPKFMSNLTLAEITKYVINISYLELTKLFHCLSMPIHRLQIYD